MRVVVTVVVLVVPFVGVLVVALLRVIVALLRVVVALLGMVVVTFLAVVVVVALLGCRQQLDGLRDVEDVLVAGLLDRLVAGGRIS